MNNIGNINGCCQYSAARFQLKVYNIFFTTVMSECMFLLMLLCISNLNTILHFLVISSVFTFSSSVSEKLVYKIFCLKVNIFLYCIESVNYIYQQIPCISMLNTISFFNVLHFVYFLHLFLLQYRDVERNPGPQKGQIKYLSCCHWIIQLSLHYNPRRL